LRDKRNLENLQFWPESLGAMFASFYQKGIKAVWIDQRVSIALHLIYNYSQVSGIMILGDLHKFFPLRIMTAAWFNMASHL